MKKVLIVTAEPDNFVPVELDKAAKAAGCESRIIDVKHLMMIEEPGASQIFCAAEDDIAKLEVDAETCVIPRLNEHHIDIKLSILERMKSCGAVLLNTTQGMDLCNDKLQTHVVLNDSGIKSPMTIALPSCDEDLEKAIDWAEKQGKIKYPVILKTLRGTHGIGVMKLDSRASLVSVAQTLQKEGLDFILQEFIEHEKSARLIMIGPEMLAANLRGQPKEKNEFRTNSHLGSETEQYQPSEREIEMGRQIVGKFQCNFCAIDYLVNGEDLTVLEVNGSPGLEAIQKNWPERNLAADVIKYVTGAGSNPTDQPVVQQPAPEIKIEPPPPQADQTLPTTSPEAVAQPALSPPTPVEPEQEVAPPETIPMKRETPPEFYNQEDRMKTISEVELVTLPRVIDEPIEARIDTGATISSLHASKCTYDETSVKFTRGDITYRVPLARTILIKNVHGGTSTRRPVIKLDVVIKDKRVNGVEFTVTDRANMKYEVLIGRNVLERVGFPVEIPKKDVGAEEGESEVQVEEE